MSESIAELVTTPVVLGTIVIAAAVLYFLFKGSPPPPPPPEEKKEPVEPRDFTLEQLREFDGTNDKPIYVCVMSEVFDVSEAAGFYGVGGPYHLFAGRDASRSLAKASFEPEDLDGRIDNLRPGEKSALYEWYEKYKFFKGYPVVGRLVTPPQTQVFSLEQLAQFNGSQAVPEGRVHPPIYVGVQGKVFDVSFGGFGFYGPGNGYHMFAGRDASRALAKMSFEPADLENRSIEDLTDAEQKVLEDWANKFEKVRKYPIVGSLASE